MTAPYLWQNRKSITVLTALVANILPVSLWAALSFYQEQVRDAHVQSEYLHHDTKQRVGLCTPHKKTYWIGVTGSPTTEDIQKFTGALVTSATTFQTHDVGVRTLEFLTEKEAKEVSWQGIALWDEGKIRIVTGKVPGTHTHEIAHFEFKWLQKNDPAFEQAFVDEQVRLGGYTHVVRESTLPDGKIYARAYKPNSENKGAAYCHVTPSGGNNRD